MKVIDINPDDGSYPVIIGNQILTELKHYIKPSQTILVITDELVSSYHMKTLQALLKDYEILIYRLSQTPEQDKHLSEYQKCVDFAITHYLDREACVLAFGGGAVGDFAGFFASTYKRGIDFIQVPTTLLAHDSSVGGKVALNHHDVKNVIGQFYQPKAVIYELSFLKTLDEEQIRSGFAEVIKHDLLSDGKMVFSLNNITDLLQDEEQLELVLEQAILTKYHYIKDDLYEQGSTRQYLNLGHTLGHAIETLYHKSHGEAILYGCCFDCYLVNPNLAYRLYDQCKKLGYFRISIEFEIDLLIESMKHDKKNQQQLLKFVVLESIGQPKMKSLSSDDFTILFKQFHKEMKW